MRKAQSAKTILAATLAAVLAGCGGSKDAEPTVASDASANPQDISGIWWAEQGTPALTTESGAPVPLTDPGKERYQSATKLAKQPPQGPADVDHCAPAGVPRVWTQPLPFQIVQKPDFTAVIYEHNRIFRIINMNQPLPPAAEVDPAFMGHSYGRWEGDTLVIESIGHNAVTYLDDTGLPHSDQLKVIERIRKINQDKSLQIEVTLEDPQMFTQPWVTRLQFERRPDAKIEEYICGYGVLETRFTRNAAPATSP